jgi:hypothetical protein
MPKAKYLFVVGALLLVGLALSGRKLDLPPAVEAFMPDVLRTIAKPEPLSIAPISPINLVPLGSSTVDLHVMRNGRNGPVAIEVSGVPEGVTASVQSLSDEASTTKIECTASADLGDRDLEATVTVTASIAKDTAAQQFVIRVPSVGRPSFATIERIVMKPGMEENVAIHVQRNGFEEAITIQPLSTPQGVHVPKIDLPKGVSSAVLHLVIGDDAVEGECPVALEMSAYGRKIVSGLPLVIDSVPYRVRSLRVVKLRPGETVEMQLPVERTSYFGPVQLSAQSMPAHVSMLDVVVPADQKTANVCFQAGESAVPCVQSVTIKANAGRLEDEGAIVIRVIDEDDDRSLPREIIAADAIGRISIGGSFGSRTSSSGMTYLGEFYGSSTESRASIARGLEWLSNNQENDGSWRLSPIEESSTSPRTDPMAADEPLAATALALLPFLAEGVTHKRSSNTSNQFSRSRTSVERGLDFMMRAQAVTPGESNAGRNGSPMGHALRTLALAEAYGLSKDEKLKPPLKSAIRTLLNAQEGASGGWQDQAESPAELMPTAWNVMALRNAQYAHVPVPKKALERAEDFVEDCRVGRESSPKAVYANSPGGNATPITTAMGLFVRQILGCQRNEADVAAGCDSIMTNLPPERGETVGSGETWGDREYYFFATQVLRNREGDDFDLWNHLVRDHLVVTQETEGPSGGSWSPLGETLGETPSLRTSRIYATAISLLTLQVYHRNLPLYRPVKLRAEDTTEVADDSGEEEMDEKRKDRP